MSGETFSPKPLGYLTPDTTPAATTCRFLSIPDDVFWIGAFTGALLELTNSENWQAFGSVTPEDAAATAKTIVLEYLESDCADLGGSGDMEHIATVELTGTATSLSLDSIPATYQELILTLLLRSDYTGSTSDDIGLRFNDDTASNYIWAGNRWQHSDNGYLGAATLSASNIQMRYICGADDTPTGLYPGTVLRLPNYAQTGKKRTAIWQGNHPRRLTAATTPIGINGQGFWTNTADAISKLTLTPLLGSNLVAGSRVQLYGVKGA